ncbi:glycosyltransferase family 4 protein [Marinilabiliaceae bacterium ANBcel2]|nr:glycosyltransferase family 4 protein [Marinilabiliaceae bacterium ANBcel2]
MISLEIASKVLVIGPEYNNSKGGVGQAIANFAFYYEDFRFVSTYKNKNVGLLTYFGVSLLRFVYILIVNRNIKVLHFHVASRGSFYRKFILFLLGKYLWRKKVIFHLHGGGFANFYNNGNFLQKEMINVFINNSNIFISPSKALYNQVHNVLRIKINHSFLPNVIVPPKQVNKIQINKSKKLRCLYLGAINDNKGIFDLLKEIGKSDFLQNNILLTICGGGEVERLKDYIFNEKLSNCTRFLGFVNGKLKEDLFNSNELLILPSYIENFPIVILEAFHYNLPVLATKVGGIPEMVENEVTGYLFDVGDFNQLNTVLCNIINKPSQLSIMRGFIRDRLRKFGSESVIEKLELIYKSLL